MSDLDMLTVLADPVKFKRYYHHVRGNFLTQEGENIAKGMSEYLDDGHTGELDWSHFAAWFFVKNSMMNFEKKDNHKKIFDALAAKPKVDENFTRKILAELTTKSFADEISKKAAAISDGSDAGDLEDIEHLVREGNETLMDLDTADDPTLAPKNFSFVTDPEKNGPVMTFSLEGLRKACAGIRKGHLVVVGAHPNTGKTTFLLGEVAHMLPQLPDDKEILYFNNEQAVQDMQMRLVTAVTGQTEADIKADPVSVEKLFDDAGGYRIHLYDKSYMNVRYVMERIRRHEGKIGLIVFDQLWKIRGASKSQNDFMQLAHIFSWARDIAKEHAPVIAVHQADGDTMGREKYLTMDHLFGSRIAIQGEADAIITIGRLTDKSTRDDLRHFHVPKNKLPAGTDPTDREPRFDAFIDHNHVKYKDIK